MSAEAGVRAKKAYHHGDLRQQLVTATRLLVEERGPDNFSVSEACRRAGVSTAAPYRHFHDRQEMLHAVAREGMREMAEEFERALEGLSPGSPEALGVIGRAYVDFASAHPGVFRMMFAAHEDAEGVQEAGERCYGVVQAQVAAALGRQEVDEDVLRAAFRLWTFVHGLAFLRIDGKVEFGRMEGEIDVLIADAVRRLLL